MHRTIRAAGLLALTLTLAACGGDIPAVTETGPASGTCLEGTQDCDDTGILDDDAGDVTATPASGMCAPDVTDCDDTAGETDGQHEPEGDAFDDEAAIAQAQELLGLTDAELGPDVRVGRRGEEQLTLTEDYRLGRMTVELDVNDMDEWIVTAVTVELADAPQTFTRYLE